MVKKVTRQKLPTYQDSVEWHEQKKEQNCNEHFLGDKHPEEKQNRLANIVRAVEIFKRKEDLSEIRILNTNEGVISGYFDDQEKMASEAILYDGKYNIFKTMNPVKPGLKDRSPNRLTTRAKQTTADSDIESIQYILIDLDPSRPAGVSATNKEKENALDLAGKIKAYFKEIGMPEVIEADSGNGYHLILKVDLENTSENVEMIKKFLKYLHFRFSTNVAEVDQSTYNPARITKLYGTTACKGENTEERPHRRSELLHVPEQIQPATAQQIKAVADTLPEVCQNIPKPEGTKWNIPELIEKYDLDLAYQKQWGGKHTIYIFKTCPWNPEHTNNAAFIIQFDNGAVDAGCHHNGCANENWSTLKEKLGIKAEKEGREKQSDVMLNLIEDCQFFHDKDEIAYAMVPIDGHSEILMVRSKKFKQFLLRRYYLQKKSAPGKDGINETLDIAEMKAQFDGAEQVIDKRVAMTADKEIYYDLADAEYRMVKISAEGCSIVQKAPVYFVRSKNMKAQVIPDLNAKPEELLPLIKKHISMKDEADLILFVVNLVSCFIQSIPHTILVFFGEKGASKSTTMRMVKRIVDPAMIDLLSMPTSLEDLAIVLNNHYMPSFDNLERLSAAQSNMLCMAATGGAFSKRTLHSNSDETIHQFKKSIQLNGVNIVATKSDLLDRSIILELERIKKKNRLTEEEIWQKFDEDLPRILGAIFNALSKAILLHRSEKLDEVGRMADFSYWGHAIAEVLGITGDVFLKAYLGNQGKANEEAISSNPTAAAIIALMRYKKTWTSSVSGLLKELEQVAADEHISIRQKIWPANANSLSKRLKEVKSNLEEIGIYYDIRHGGDCKKITIENTQAIEVIETRPELAKTQEINPNIFAPSALLEYDSPNQEIDMDQLLSDIS